MIIAFSKLVPRHDSNEGSRDPKSLNFPDGKIQSAKTRVNRLYDKKTCVNCFSQQIKSVSRFRDKKYIELQFDLQVKEVCAVFVESHSSLMHKSHTFGLIKDFLDHQKLSR